MRLLFVADLHYSLKQFDWVVARAGEFDATVICGDLLDLGSALDPDLQIAIVEKYLRQLREKTRVLVSSGNHDGDSRNSADESVAEWIVASRAERLHVDGDSLDLNGARITICPWWDGDLSRTEIEAQLAREASQVRGQWIWIHHAPPIRTRTSWTGRKDGGDEALREWIEQYHPDMVFSGHIHNSPFYEDGSWIDRIGTTWVFNPGRQPGPEPTSIVLDLDAMTAEWQSAADRSIRDLRALDR